MHKLRIIFIAFLFGSIGACQSSIEIAEFDQQQWVKDVGGCNGSRLSFSDVLKENQDKIKGHNQSRIIELLGRPDAIKLLSRNQKQYKYFVLGGEACKDENPVYLVINFNATGLANELIIF